MAIAKLNQKKTFVDALIEVFCNEGSFSFFNTSIVPEITARITGTGNNSKHIKLKYPSPINIPNHNPSNNNPVIIATKPKNIFIKIILSQYIKIKG